MKMIKLIKDDREIYLNEEDYNFILNLIRKANRPDLSNKFLYLMSSDEPTRF